MKCSVCNGRGMTKSVIAKNNTSYPVYNKCRNPKCGHTDLYYAWMRLKYSTKPYGDKILEFRKTK